MRLSLWSPVAPFALLSDMRKRVVAGAATMISPALMSSAGDNRQHTYTIQTVQLIMDADNDNIDNLFDDSLKHEGSDNYIVTDRNSRHVKRMISN